MKTSPCVAVAVGCAIGIVIGAFLHVDRRVPGPVAEDPAPEAASALDRSQSAANFSMTYQLPLLGCYENASGKMCGVCEYFPMSIDCTGERESLRVLYSENTPSGAGDTIRNSLWTAALVAALQKESTLQGVKVSLGFSGAWDGPSAGAVMCLAIMSGLDRRAFPDDFAMTGALLPDGTIGLVGGVSAKLAAAAQDPKIKRVAIPAFQRFELLENGQWVDLFELGTSLNLELRPVESIFDAYLFLHRITSTTGPRLSAVSTCREASWLELDAAEVFAERYETLKARINGLPSEDRDLVTNVVAWADINPEVAKNRFEEGAIFDALNLISAAAAKCDAVLETWHVYDKFEADFTAREGAVSNGVKVTLGDLPLSDWPIDKQVSFIDGFRAVVRGVMEKKLGYCAEKEQDDVPLDSSGANEVAESTGTWDGFYPHGAVSDIEAQFQSVLETERASAVYRSMTAHSMSPDALKVGIEEGALSIDDELDNCRDKLFAFMTELGKKQTFAGVAMPILNSGPEIDAALLLFDNAWKVVDKSIDTDIVDGYAECSAIHRNDARLELMGMSEDYSTYEDSKMFTRGILAEFEEASKQGRLTFPGWTKSYVLFNVAELFAEASAQLFALDGGKSGNVTFVAFAMDRARREALQSIHACRSYGIPYFGPVLRFQRSERARASGEFSPTDVLADYWKATMTAKALVMAFRNGIGPEQGFNGYSAQEPPDGDAKEADDQKRE